LIGDLCSANVLQAFDMPVLNRLDQYKVHCLATPFMRRITAMAWHPLFANLLAVEVELS